MELLNEAQRRKIWATAKELEINSKDLHLIVWTETDKEHISELTKQEAIDVIQRLETVKANRLGIAYSMATKKQLWKIEQLIKELDWDNSKRLQKFISKYAKVDSIKWLTKKDAAKIIEGLKAMADRKAKDAPDIALSNQ